MTRLPVALAFTLLLATQALAAGKAEAPDLHVITAATTQPTPTDDTLFGHPDWSISAATPADPLAR